MKEELNLKICEDMYTKEERSRSYIMSFWFYLIVLATTMHTKKNYLNKARRDERKMSVKYGLPIKYGEY